GRGNQIETLRSLQFPHSLGLFYSAFTYYTGFRVNSGEYKLMGLAPYGEPRFADLIRRELIDIKPDGSFHLDMGYFGYCDTLRMTNARFDRLFGAPPRRPEEPIRDLDLDLAASVQAVTEDVMLRAARHAHELTGLRNLCLAGGVALNCVGNGRILRDGPFEDVWIQPAAGDAGGALGAALFVWHQLLDRPRVSAPDAQKGSLLGPAFGEEDVRVTFDALGAVYRRVPDEAELCADVARLIDEQNVVGWFQGRMEFGPRALGSRSILGDPRSTEMQRTMNLKIKFRESFRPFAPSVLREAGDRYFELGVRRDSPYMLLVAPLRAEHRLPVSENGARGLDRLHIARSTLPAVTHVDWSARMQTVDARTNGRYHRLLRAFEARTGCPVLINTSFNVRGQPIVRSPEEAYRCFMGTNMDALVVGEFVLLKSEQPAELDTRGEFAEAFEKD
ncbi:MAG: carbamoyltransferase family protein, partial [Longimicrobiales bacterium]